MNHYLESCETVLQEVNSDRKGLTKAEAAKRLEENGKNEITKAPGKSLLSRLIEQLVNPMVLILLVTAVISTIIAFMEGGDIHSFAEAGVVMAVVIFNSILGVIQESKAEKSIEALQEMSAATARVRRDDTIKVINANELVVGDIILIEAGDAIPADLRLIKCSSLRIEESALTGESVPVDKISEILKGYEDGKVTLGDRKNMAYLGSNVTYGRGEAVVVATAMDTEMGKIADIIQSAEQGETPLQIRLEELSRVLTYVTLGICVVIFAIELFSQGNFSADGILDSFMLAIALAVAAIPEGLVAVVTIVLSMGVTKMAKQAAIIRRLTAVETLGCAQVICSDKTGTLTQNKMTVVELYGDKEALVKAMALCCDSQIAPDGDIIGDPTENALVAYALKEGLTKEDLTDKTPRVGEAPFDSIRKMMSTIHKTDNGYIQYTKGAFDEVLKLCKQALVDGKVVPLTDKIVKEIEAKNSEYADRALRVLAGSYRELAKIPEDCSPANIEKDLIFIGLEAMIDPVRPEVKAAIESCNRSGIKVVMITGDHVETAIAIARELGLITGKAQAMTGREIDELDDEEFSKKVETVCVYARVQPEHKVRIVNALKDNGYITAMTGDGVNDAPAIKSGDIGVGMGITGTDVTKNVADMVLADDNFATIVSAVKEGRRIYDNIRKTIHFLLSSNISEVLSVFIASLILKGAVLFRPVHLLFINLITDSIPAIALGMEHAQPGIMDRPPRGMKEGVFSGGAGFDMIYQGVALTAITLGAYLIVDIWHDHVGATTAAFLAMSMGEIFHAYNMRSQRQSIFTLKTHNVILWAAMIASLALTLAVIYTPFLADIFDLTALTFKELGVALGLSISIIPLVEIVKFIQNKLEKNK